MTNKSSPVISNQTGVHEDLEQIVKKHIKNPYRKPYRNFSEEIFHQIDDIHKKSSKKIILDSGCGNGDSSIMLANTYPKDLVIGIDKSEKRLQNRLIDKNIYHENNLILVRGDVVDIWRMAMSANWNIKKHYLLYPNPWPKKDQIKRRWHGHPVFPHMVSLCGNIELRTNWKIYAEEFKQALQILTKIKPCFELIDDVDLISPFEKKYYMSGIKLYCVSA